MKIRGKKERDQGTVQIQPNCGGGGGLVFGGGGGFGGLVVWGGFFLGWGGGGGWGGGVGGGVLVGGVLSDGRTFQLRESEGSSKLEPRRGKDRN